MKVTMMMCQAGADFVRNRGDVVEVGDAEGARMIDAGIAAPVRSLPEPERAVKRSVREKATG